MGSSPAPPQPGDGRLFSPASKRLPAVLFFLLIGSLPVSATASAKRPSVPRSFSYRLTDLGTLPGYESSVARRLNERNQVVGSARRSKPYPQTHAFLWDRGKIVDLGAIPSPMENTDSLAYGINDRGQVVGSMGGYFPLSMSGLEEAGAFLWENGRMTKLGGNRDWSSFEAFDINDRGWAVGVDSYRAFLWRNGRFKTLDPISKRPSGNATKATALNERGWVVGGTTIPQKGVRSGWEPDGIGIVIHAFLWKNGVMRDLETLPSFKNSIAADLNDRGQVVGWTGSRAGWQSVGADEDGRAFLWSRGRMIDLGALPGAAESAAYGINNRGEVVGRSGGHAVLWREGRLHDLNAALPKNSGWTLVEARDVNDHGEIVGAGRKTGDAELHAFLLASR